MPTGFERGYVVGVDIGGTKIEAVLLSDEGAVVSSGRLPARQGGDQVVSDVEALVRQVAGTLFSKLAMIGVGIPGQVNAQTGHVSNVVNLGIGEYDLGSVLQRRLGLPVRVENDVNVAALGAAGIAKAPKKGTTVFLNFGTGLAAGIIIDNQLQHGESGAVGEIGHLPVDPNRFDCPCGQKGCLETVCSGSAVSRLWPYDNPALPGLIAAAQRGERNASEILAKVTHAMGDAVQIVVQLTDPRRIIIGGGMAKTGKPLLDLISREIGTREKHCAFLRNLDIASRLELARLDEPLGAIGAALLCR
ncbi:ROK family protein [Bifidobacterium sp. ESL0800]|uniref:ROK family protein n=1 Tax=Bifidobacterium sp. ESL0800 TaxID=2983236 RepID=UPI0023F69084|nr:ROK family protein [Bifidobacterium sp. ESL0800]WEV74951.1 ROK family protein [Bifidobacterium sp. ESL0800]